MHALDHLTIIAPTLEDGVAHVRGCLDLDVPFGTRHAYMGTHNHRLQLGGRVYLEIVAIDPKGTSPGWPRWFGLDDQNTVHKDWEAGRRLRGWVARTDDMDATLAPHDGLFGAHVSLPPEAPEFGFSIPQDGGLPFDGAAPSWIDHRSEPTSMADIPDLGARLVSFTMTHPELSAVTGLYQSLAIEGAPDLVAGSQLTYRAEIKTSSGLRVLT